MKQFFVLGFITVLFLVGMGMYQYVQFHDGKLHVIFCSVGEGDGIIFKTPSGKVIVNDGGPNTDILSCLANHVPFWDKTIQLVILSHPHSDHLIGLINLLSSYSVKAFATERLRNTTASFAALTTAIQNSHLTVQYIQMGDKLTSADGFSLLIVGPSQAFLERTSPHGVIGETGEFGSLETKLSYGTTSVLLTGDSQASELAEAINAKLLGQVDVLQSPHHGSKTGLDQGVLTILSPRLVVISVGPNMYGHPNQLTINLLKQNNIPFFRTDQVGDIELVSDGKKWEYKK